MQLRRVDVLPPTISSASSRMLPPESIPFQQKKVGLKRGILARLQRKGGRGLASAGPLCQITVSSCPKNPNYQGGFLDPDASATASEVACFQRAQYWHDWCGTSSATATYSAAGTASASSTYSTTCKVSEDSCQADASKAGTFTSPNPTANANPAACIAEAAHYALLCGSATSTAAFYTNGNLAQSVRYPLQTACMITLPTCASKPDAVGAFQDTEAEPNRDQQACVSEAGNYQRICGGRRHGHLGLLLRWRAPAEDDGGHGLRREYRFLPSTSFLGGLVLRERPGGDERTGFLPYLG